MGGGVGGRVLLYPTAPSTVYKGERLCFCSSFPIPLHLLSNRLLDPSSSHSSRSPFRLNIQLHPRNTPHPPPPRRPQLPSPTITAATTATSSSLANQTTRYTNPLDHSPNT